MTTPTTEASFTSESPTVTVSGTAALEKGVRRVSWSNSQGGGGVAEGTREWTIGAVPLEEGANVITVTAQDATGSSVSASITITHGATRRVNPTTSAISVGALASGAPIIVDPGPQKLFVGQRMAWFVFDVSDPDGDTVTCTTSGLPPGLEMDEGRSYCAVYGFATSEGVFRWTLTASDGTRETALVSTWTVSATGTAAEPHLPPPPPDGAWWGQRVDSASLHPDSRDMIATLESLGGFGYGRLHIDFGIHVVYAGADAPTRTLTRHPYGYFRPDCDPTGTAIPVPEHAAIEGVAGMTCRHEDQDCHYVVLQGNTLYEMWAASAAGSDAVESRCLAIWEWNRVYPPEGRGEHCTSADAAGFPIAPLLFNPDEIARSLEADPAGGGDLGHAIRFILPNARMASDPSLGGVGGALYVRPATHAGRPGGPSGSVPYGSRLRLRAGFPLDGYAPAARVLLNTMKRYGMALADGGKVALTAESDLYTRTSWSDLGIDSRVFDRTRGATAVHARDFEVVDTGPRIAETRECLRAP